MKFTFENHAPEISRSLIKKPGLVMKAIDKRLHRAAIELANQGKTKAPKAFSQLTNSINTIRFGIADHGVAAGASYARHVEDGSRSGGSPSIQSLIDWIRVKGIIPDDPNMDEEDLAYVIQRMITINGTPAQPFLRPAFNQIVSTLPALLAADVNQVMSA